MCSELTQAHRGTRGTQPEAKARVQALCEPGLKGVDVSPHTGGHSVERQCAGVPVKEHPHPLWARGALQRWWWDGHQCSPLAMACCVVVGGAVEAPGLVVTSQAALLILPLPGDALVGHPDGHHPRPLHLPVAAAGQALPTQHLPAVVEAVRVASAALPLVHQGHPSAVRRQTQPPVRWLLLQCQFTRIWWGRQDVHSFGGGDIPDWLGNLNGVVEWFLPSSDFPLGMEWDATFRFDKLRYTVYIYIYISI